MPFEFGYCSAHRTKSERSLKDSNNSLVSSVLCSALDRGLMECLAAIRTSSDLPPDECADALMCDFAMRGNLAYPCPNGGYRAEIDGTLTQLRNFYELKKQATKIGINA